MMGQIIMVYFLLKTIIYIIYMHIYSKDLLKMMNWMDMANIDGATEIFTKVIKYSNYY